MFDLSVVRPPSVRPSVRRASTILCALSEKETAPAATRASRSSYVCAECVKQSQQREGGGGRRDQTELRPLQQQESMSRGIKRPLMFSVTSAIIGAFLARQGKPLTRHCRVPCSYRWLSFFSSHALFVYVLRSHSFSVSHLGGQALITNRELFDSTALSHGGRRQRRRRC